MDNQDEFKVKKVTEGSWEANELFGRSKKHHVNYHEEIAPYLMKNCIGSGNRIED